MIVGWKSPNLADVMLGADCGSGPAPAPAAAGAMDGPVPGRCHPHHRSPLTPDGRAPSQPPSRGPELGGFTSGKMCVCVRACMLGSAGKWRQQVQIWYHSFSEGKTYSRPLVVRAPKDTRCVNSSSVNTGPRSP